MRLALLLKDYRFYCLALALLTMAGLFLYPRQQQSSDIYKLMIIVDITRSMNAEDYRLDDKPVSRLGYVKHSLRQLIKQLPCQSQVGLGVFTERRSTVLFEPIEVCAGYAELDKSLAALDWRMAWAADSRIGAGLLSTLALLAKQGSAVFFITDGQEAPPLNPRYRTDFSAVKNQLPGSIIGVGGLQAVEIPKFNSKGQREGVYQMNDLPQRSSFGESDLNPEKIEGYDARNAPFGKAAAIGSEHLSALQESYLQQLAIETGLGYQRLQDEDSLPQALRQPGMALQQSVAADVRWRAALVVLGLMLLIFL